MTTSTGPDFASERAKPDLQTQPPGASPSWWRAVANAIGRLYGGGSPPVTFVLTRWLFLRLLGLIYLFAFGALWVQITGLIGSHGILPLTNFLTAVRDQLPYEHYQLLPTVFWLNSSDGFLMFICGAGTFLSLLVVLDVLTVPSLILMWGMYLSLFHAGQDFMGFQWDILLLEVGFLAIFLAPWHILPKLTRQPAPPMIILWLLRLALFRLMFESGFVKLDSGDPTWRNLTATTFHYQTQPLPTPLAWYAHQLPLAWHQIEVLGTFFVELFVPLLIFLPRRFRLIAAALIIVQQLLIFLTGNYTFFNLLTMVMCIPLLDDRILQRVIPARLAQPMVVSVQARMPILRRVILVVVSALVLVLNADKFGNLFLTHGAPPVLTNFASQVDPLHLVNEYGLFARMTTTRPEIIIEGSIDGTTWLPYTFKYKPGDPAHAPTFVAPYHPRLDWQMWFAALEPSPPVWFDGFVVRLLQGSPDVLALMGNNPFPNVPPKYIRAELYLYTFTDSATRQSTGNWWNRTQTGEYLRPVSLDDFSLGNS